MYKVDYYTLARLNYCGVGNTCQYKDTWYTEKKIEDIPNELQKVIDVIKGVDEYVPVIESIKIIEGHGDR